MCIVRLHEWLHFQSKYDEINSNVFPIGPMRPIPIRVPPSDIINHHSFTSLGKQKIFYLGFLKIVSVLEPKNKDTYLNLTYLRGTKDIFYYILSLASQKKKDREHWSQAV